MSDPTPARIERVFVSYAHTDERLASTLVARLQTEGFDVWFAGERLRPGDSLSLIFDRIKACDAFIVLWSRDSRGSSWVQKEVDVALTRALSARPLLILPCVLESVADITKLSDLLSVDLREGRWDEGFQQIVDRLRDLHPKDPPYLRTLEAFFNDQVVLDPDTHRKVTSNAGLLRTVANAASSPPLDEMERTHRQVQHEMAERAYSEIESALVEAGIGEHDRRRILEALMEGRNPPIIDRRHVVELRRFARRTDDSVIRLAEDLWQGRSFQGTTMEAVADWAWLVLQRDFGLEDRDLLPWKSECLVRAAMEAGLLVRSSEQPRGYAARDAQFNPSYDMGPMVHIAGGLVAEFLAQKRRRISLG